VIARNSSFTYKGRAVDVKQIGHELGVRYVLEGSLRKAGNRIRVTAQLVEAETGKHVWAERYDRDLADIFAVQDEITEAVTIAIAPAIADAERQRALRKPPANLDAWAAYQRGLWHMGKANPEDYTLAEGLFEKAIELDPNFSGGYRGLAFAQFLGASVFQLRALPDAQASAEGLARRAIALDGNDAESRAILSQTLSYRGDDEGALAEAERALAISPNLAFAQGRKGVALVFSGQPEAGIAALRAGMRLDPHAADVPIRWLQVVCGLYFCRDYEAAIEEAKGLIRSYPDIPNSYRWLAASLGELGRVEEAKAALNKAVAVTPASFDMYIRSRVPWMRPQDHAHMLEGLRKAGWEG
jgi:adenylate cyclase